MGKSYEEENNGQHSQKPKWPLHKQIKSLRRTIAKIYPKNTMWRQTVKTNHYQLRWMVGSTQWRRYHGWSGMGHAENTTATGSRWKQPRKIRSCSTSDEVTDTGNRIGQLRDILQNSSEAAHRRLEAEEKEKRTNSKENDLCLHDKAQNATQTTVPGSIPTDSRRAEICSVCTQWTRRIPGLQRCSTIDPIIRTTRIY